MITGKKQQAAAVFQKDAQEVSGASAKLVN